MSTIKKCDSCGAVHDPKLGEFYQVFLAIDGRTIDGAASSDACSQVCVSAIVGEAMRRWLGAEARKAGAVPE